MNLITRSATNTVVFTLTERVTISSPYFLVRAKSRRTNQIKRFILNANTGETARYDKFTIIENATEDLTNSTVTLTGGDWWYDIYEQASSTSLNELVATTLLESGIFRVIDSTETYVTTDTEETYVV